MTLYLSRLAMARLVVYQTPEIAQEYYLDAILGRWQIDPIEFQSICNLKKPADPNLKLVTILLESAHMLAVQPCGTGVAPNKEARLRGETALTLFAMATALTEAEFGHLGAVHDSDRMVGVVNVLRSMSKVYKHLGMTFYSAACLIHAGEWTLEQDCNADNPKDDNAREMLLLWDLFQALLLAMETGDVVRMQRAIQLLNRCHPAALFYKDVQTIIQIASAVISQDNDYLHYNASCALEHLLLLIQDGDEDAKAQLLLCQLPQQYSASASLAN
ncbi:hypothetical protein BGZ65_006209 [Modicella reniformis]|uniref:Uncharacterized protein n=1 Tax=Modicella reniformis TaxID=1440133 RepID=A0A9P6J7H2_9FUNG|nr:hypothetical protein BGZ65_006209 [Modicella reniformis]